MSKGGYQIIDLENRNFVDSTGQVFEGVYEQIEGTNKVVLLSNIKYDGDTLRDVFATFKLNGSNFYTTIYNNLQVKIEDADVITITEI